MNTHLFNCVFYYKFYHQRFIGVLLRIFYVSKYNHSQRNHWLLLLSGYVIQEDPPDISPSMFKPLIGKGHPEFSIRSQQIDNIGEDGLLYLDIFPVLSDAQDSTGTTRRVCQIHKWV